MPLDGQAQVQDQMNQEFDNPLMTMGTNPNPKSLLDRERFIARSWLFSQDDEIESSVIVAALVFTVATSAVIEPHDKIREGSHTDLYGALCVITIMANLGSVLTGTIMSRLIRHIGNMLQNDDWTADACMLCRREYIRMLLALPALLMWAGILSMTATILLNVHEVFDESDISFHVMLICIVGLVVVVFIAGYALISVRHDYNVHGDFDLLDNAQKKFTRGLATTDDFEEDEYEEEDE